MAAAVPPGWCPGATAGSIFEDGSPLNFDDILELPDLDIVLTEARGSDSASPDRANPQTFNADEEQIQKALRRQRRLQEKGRKSQQRYRDRQKEKLQAAEQEVEALRAQLDQLSASQQALESRNNFLEKQLTAQPRVPDIVPSGVNAILAQVASQRPQQQAVEVCPPLGSGHGLDLQVLNQKHVLLAEAATTFHAVVYPNKIKRFTPESFCHVMPDGISRIWQDYTRRLVELQQEAAMGAPEATIQMCKLVEEQRRASAALVSFDPDLHRRAMLKLQRDLLAFGGAQPKEFHAAVLAAAAPTAEQKQELLSHRLRVGADVNCLLRERRHLLAALQSPPLPGQPVGHCAKMQETVQKLRGNLDAEFECWSELTTRWLDQVLSPLQTASAYAMTYPEHPNVHQFAGLLAAEIGEALPAMDYPASAANPLEMLPAWQV